MQRHICSSVEETEQIAQALAAQLKPGDVVAYEGGMGMGKTAFTRGIVSGLCGDDVVSSPTFALMNQYDTPAFPVYHFDMYRINGWDDLYSTGFFDYLESGGVLLVEWSENIAAALPEHTIIVRIQPGDNENQRIITIERG